MRRFIIALFFAVFLLPVEAQYFMKVAADLVITKDNKRCFLIKPGYSRKDTVDWEPYCGRLINFFYEQGYEYTLHVDKFDPSAPVIRVINTIGRDNSESYKKRLALKKRWEEEERAQALINAQANAQAQEQTPDQTSSQTPAQTSSQTENIVQTQPQIEKDHYEEEDYYDDDGYDYDYNYDDGYEYDYY